MRRRVAGIVLLVSFCACAEGDQTTVPGYRVSVPGAFVGRFPPNPLDPEAGLLIEGAFGMAVGDKGGVFVLDQRGRQVFHLDRDAKLRAVIGQPGGGPGEFEAPLSIQPHPTGGVWASDPRLGRLSRFGAEGDLAEELPTPWTVTNFGIRRDGTAMYATTSLSTLLATQQGADHRELMIDPAVIPSEIGRHPAERLMNGALQYFEPWPDTVLMFQNRNAKLFGAWKVALGSTPTEVTGVVRWPLPHWIVNETASSGAVVETETRGGRTQVTESVPFNSVRVVDQQLWLVTGLIDDVLLASVPLIPGDSASVVLPPEGGIDCLMDALVLGDRLVVQCEIEVRVYELDRVPAERFRHR